MKGKHFYSHLIEIHDVYINIEGLDLSDEQRNHLMTLIEANIHTSIVHTTLSYLPTEDKKIFLKNLVSDNHKKTWAHLKDKIENAEDKISKSLAELKEEVLKDIEESKKI